MQALLNYVDQCNVELEAAKHATLRSTRLGHLQRAFHYAQLAVEERAKASNIAPWPRARVRRM